MKYKFLPFLRLFVFVLLVIIISNQLLAQTVNVKMRVNTSTCLDTLSTKHILYLCGETSNTAGTTPAITWDPKTTALVAKNVGGDYWEVSFKAQAGDIIKYKFVAFFDAATSTFHWTGWEGPIDAGFNTGDNRGLVVGKKDTTLALQYFNGWESKLAQYWKPFASKADTVAVYFRVNMGGADFNPATQVVDVRGGAPLGTDSPWITIKTLSRETNSVGGGSFWSGVAYVAKANITAGAQQKFKFVIQPDKWESISDRAFTFTASVKATGDTTIHWAYFNNQRPTGPKVNANLLWRLKLDALERAGMFNRAYGDKIAITGAKGWPPSTFTFDTEPAMLKMTYNSDLEEWNLFESFSKYPKEAITYKYYIQWDTSRVSPTNPRYIPGLQLTNGWEEPGVTGGADRSYTYTDKTSQIIAGDFGADQQFFNSLHPNGVIKTPIKIKFSINMVPATNATTNPTATLFRPGIDTVFVQFDGCMVPVTQGKTMWGTDNRIILTDPNGDGIYTGDYDLTPPTFYQFCYRIVYSSPTGAVWNGTGSAVRGRRYYQYAKPTSTNPVVWPATYQLATMDWKTQDLTIENPPDLGNISDIEESLIIPTLYKLTQNYPNPFNPTTVISYSIPEIAKVKIEVYNVLGQKVVTLFDQEQLPGNHMLEWNSRNDSGVNVTSGVYLLKMQAGSFSQVKKMLLVR
jgi:hypothetical protein